MVITAHVDGNERNEFILGKTKYLYNEDAEYDYLTDVSENKIKVDLRFSKDKVKNELARKALKKFFSELLL